MDSGSAFTASAASSLVSGYCSDFVQLAATMAQTLEQISMRELPLGDSQKDLLRVERGMRDLADAIASLMGSIGPDGRAHPHPSVRVRAATVGRGARGTAADPAAVIEAPAPASTVVPDLKPESLAGCPTRPPGTVVFQGTSDSMPLRSVLQFLSRMRKTGTLWIAMGRERMTIEMIDGCVSGTTSDRPPDAERVGDLLVESGCLRPEELIAYRKKSGGPVPIGAALVRDGRITEEQLLEALQLQVRRRFQRAVSATAATYSFHEGTRTRGDGRIRIRPFELLDNVRA